MRYAGLILFMALKGSVGADPATQPVTPFERQTVFPGSLKQGLPATRLQPPRNGERVTLRAADGTTIVALFGRPVTPRKPPVTVLFFYGNGSWAADCLGLFNRLRSLGASVLMPDYEGYGQSGGSPSEAACYATADAAYAYLGTRPDVDVRRIVVVGWSLGGAVAIDLARRKPVAGLVTVSAFTSLPDVAGLQAGGLPAGLLLASRFDNQTKIARVTCPTLLIHGSKDTLVPPAMMGRLAKAAGGAVETLMVPDAGHNDTFQRGGDLLWRKLQAAVDHAAHLADTRAE